MAIFQELSLEIEELERQRDELEEKLRKVYFFCTPFEYFTYGAQEHLIALKITSFLFYFYAYMIVINTQSISSVFGMIFMDL